MEFRLSRSGKSSNIQKIYVPADFSKKYLTFMLGLATKLVLAYVVNLFFSTALRSWRRLNAIMSVESSRGIFTHISTSLNHALMSIIELYSNAFGTL